MFSVPANPYNSRRRQLYGGWATDLTDASTMGNSGWAADATKFFQDTKWANMADKYSLDPADRDIAANIRAISKGYLKGQRALAKQGNQAALKWVSDYNRAAKNVRSKYRLSPIPWSNKQAIWKRFLETKWKPDYSDAEKAWFALASRAPYVAVPSIPGVSEADAKQFVTSSANYAEPSRLSLAERQLLGYARRGEALSKYDAALQAYNTALAQTGDDDVATTVARSIDPTFIAAGPGMSD